MCETQSISIDWSEDFQPDVEEHWTTVSSITEIEMEVPKSIDPCQLLFNDMEPVDPVSVYFDIDPTKVCPDSFTRRAICNFNNLSEETVSNFERDVLQDGQWRFRFDLDQSTRSLLIKDLDYAIQIDEEIIPLFDDITDPNVLWCLKSVLAFSGSGESDTFKHGIKKAGYKYGLFFGDILSQPVTYMGLYSKKLEKQEMNMLNKMVVRLFLDLGDGDQN